MGALKIAFCALIAFLLISTGVFAGGQPVVNIKLNQNNTLIGGIIRLEISIKAKKSVPVFWQQCDDLFRQSQRVMLLSVDSGYANGHFIHHIIFTALKPTNLSVGSLPVMVAGQKLLSPAFRVTFKADKLPAQIYDIKSVAPTNWYALIIPYSKLFFVFIVLVAVLTAFYFLLKKWLTHKAILAHQQKCLQKLYVLELAAMNDTITAASLVEQVDQIIADYLEPAFPLAKADNLTPNSQSLPPHFLLDADKLKFLPQQVASLSCHDLLREVREFITDHQPAMAK